MKTSLKISIITCVLITLINLSDSYAQINGVINSYARVTGIVSNILTLDNVSLAPGTTLDQAFGIGQKVLIIQMKGAKVNTGNNSSFGSLQSLNNAGNYEFATVSLRADLGATQVITLTGLSRSYDVYGAVQVVSVPQYTNITVTGTIQATPWSQGMGRGGIVVMEVSGTLTLNADIDVSGQGFTGGSRNTAGSNTGCNNRRTYLSASYDATNDQHHAQKGESIADYTDNSITGLEYGRGAMLNGGGGGNSHNGGGGGGSNYTIGGNAGVGWTSAGACSPGTNTSHGIGGYSVAYSNVENKIFMGGGGGGGQQNNNHASDGAPGGGIVIIRATNLVVNSGIRGIYADGYNAQNATGNDAAGGGGGGGVIFLEVLSYTLSGQLIARANGGNGGNVQDGGAHAGGGGGGVGVILLNEAPPALTTFNSTPGVAGLDCSGGSCTRTGTSGGSTSSPYLTGWGVIGNTASLPIELKSFDVEIKNEKAYIQWITLSEENTDYFEIERSTNLKDVEAVAYQKAQGFSNQAREYLTLDEQPLQGISYYRLKSVDFDLSVTYSPWVTVSNALALAYQIYPNPSNDIINFQIIDSKEKQKILLFDKLGKIVHEGTFQEKYTIQAQTLPKGIYLVRISSSKGLIQSEIVLN